MYFAIFYGIRCLFSTNCSLSFWVLLAYFFDLDLTDSVIESSTEEEAFDTVVDVIERPTWDIYNDMNNDMNMADDNRRGRN